MPNEQRGARPTDTLKEKSTRERRVEAIKKTLVPAVVGTVAGVGAGASLGVAKGLVVPFLFLLVACVYIQKLIFPLVGVDPRELETKDWAYIVFMTFDFLFVSWAIYLNSP
ncbi:hypothetical protein [Methermicoccus shengliensis]|uniref:Uncharacterized protein n=1 Tax=Methermicoccus shengliensis TaxID=660064 RepID=A0A832VZ69_9EURY|nr:hypothetical protein [Methermicoccus shengliensis]HIH69304.1 hypothetical protein [Methermicoccus shengliensis]